MRAAVSAPISAGRAPSENLPRGATLARAGSWFAASGLLRAAAGTWWGGYARWGRWKGARSEWRDGRSAGGGARRPLLCGATFGTGSAHIRAADSAFSGQPIARVAQPASTRAYGRDSSLARPRCQPRCTRSCCGASAERRLAPADTHPPHEQYGKLAALDSCSTETTARVPTLRGATSYTRLHAALALVHMRPTPARHAYARQLARRSLT